MDSVNEWMKEQIDDEEQSINDRERLKKLGRCLNVSDEVEEWGVEHMIDIGSKVEAAFPLLPKTWSDTAAAIQ